MEKLKLPQKINFKINNFIEGLRNIYGDGLISVTLYGSAASGEFTGRHSDINLLVVLKDAGLANLGRASGLINKYKFRTLKPLFFSEDYIRSSLDVFPIEFLDMQENYFVLSGRDVLAGLVIDGKNLRFQCEQELKAKLLNLKNIYLREKNSAALRGLLFKSFTSLLHILRNLIRLKGRNPPYLKEELLKEICREFDMETDNFRRILEAKQKNLKTNSKEIESLFFNFVADLEKIISLVDKL